MDKVGDDIMGMVDQEIEYICTFNERYLYPLSKENLSITYGIYIYHVDAPEIGQKTGTFGVIK